jgi:hypothetical protein
VIDGDEQQILDGRVVTTGDGQASISVPSGAIPHVKGATGVRFEITPLDPATLGEPPPGLQYDGNALRMEGFYEPSGDPVTFTPQDCSLGGCVTVIARYAHAGTQLWLQDGSAWREVLDTTVFSSTFTIAAPVLQLGTFVVTKIPGTGPAGSNLTMIIAFVAGGLAVAGAVYVQLRRARAARARAKRSSSAKNAPRRGSASKGKGGATRGRARR